MIGTCTKTLERETLLDKAKLKYATKLEEGDSSVPTVSTAESEAETNAPPEIGWALKQAKRATRFTETQKEYLVARFNIGQESGMKLDAAAVAKEMRRARGADGERLFKISDFLTAQQVASFFSRTAAKLKQQTAPGEPPSEYDILAMEEESNISNTKETVRVALHVQHPITWDQYDICAMVKAKSLQKLKLDLLKLLCEKMSINLPQGIDRRRKAPYICLLEDLVKYCPCSTLQH